VSRVVPGAAMALQVPPSAAAMSTSKSVGRMNASLAAAPAARSA
jgi:hypothetical protein